MTQHKANAHVRIDKGLSLQESHTIYHTLIQMISQEPQTDWRCGAVQKNKNSNNSVECVLEFQDFINGDQYSGRIRGLCSNGQNAWPVFPIELPYLLLGLSSRVGGWLRHTQASEQIILSVSCCFQYKNMGVQKCQGDPKPIILPWTTHLKTMN